MSKNATPAAAKNSKTAKKATKAEVITNGEGRTHKICSICKTPQPLENFYRPLKDCRCKSCGKVYSAQLRAKKAEVAGTVAATPAPAKAVKKTAKK
jgi:hypothetical protein